ncbi:MAG: hypothetical protein LRY25_00495, partial [Flavobacterium sp.]|nr:hypothetical protein [Flavobacterium sp.]
ITGMQLAEDIGPGLAKAVVAMKVDGVQKDIYLPIEKDARVELLTPKQPEGLDVMRHTTTAQVLARALKELYPGTKLAIGPTIEHGFYYDVESPKPIPIDDGKNHRNFISGNSSILNLDCTWSCADVFVISCFW